MKIVYINIDNGNDRNNMIIALANAGIPVRVKSEKEGFDVKYWVIFELPENNIK